MSRLNSKDRLLRSQLKAVNRPKYSIETIEKKIVDSLCQHGEFKEQIDAYDLAIIMRNIVYTMFGEFRLAGLDIGLLHNVPSIKVAIANGEARISYLVHIHRPIIAFLAFQYTVENDVKGGGRKLRLKRGSFNYTERTRPLDLKARAALAAVNIKHIAQKELQDLGQIISKTLPAQLEQYGVSGELDRVELQVDGKKLRIWLQGDFAALPKGQLVQPAPVIGS